MNMRLPNIEQPYYDTIRFEHDQSYKKGVMDGFIHVVNLQEQEHDDQLACNAAYHKQMLNERLWGWEGDALCCYFWFVGWDCFSLGLHICFSCPNIEIHLPFGFVRLGWKRALGIR